MGGDAPAVMEDLDRAGGDADPERLLQELMRVVSGNWWKFSSGVLRAW